MAFIGALFVIPQENPMRHSNRAIKGTLLTGLAIAVLAGVAWGVHWYFTPAPRQAQAAPLLDYSAALTQATQNWLTTTESVASIKSELAHEKDRSATAATLTPNTWDRLESLETVLDAEKRQWLRAARLVSLHAQSTSDFVEAQGFGMGRMIPLAPSHASLYVDLEEAPSGSFTRYDVKTFTGKEAPATATPRAPASDKLATLPGLHVEGMLGFFNSGGLGLVAPPMQPDKGNDSARYRPHGFGDDIPVPNAEVPSKRRWLVRKVELVSLLKHADACAYVSDSLPRMKDRRRAKTRPLTDFERKALTALQGGDDLISEATDSRIQLLGSLRAGRQCLDCHDVERGALLGAFSYELRRHAGDGARK
jgi:hypothetical protein